MDRGNGPLNRVSRAGERVAGEARRKQYAFARRHWRWLATMAMLCLLPNGVSLLFGSDFSQGLLLGLTLALAVGVPAWSVVMLTGTAPTMMGGEAERWTAEELQALEAHGCRIVHHAALRPGDMDHMVVGPIGVFVVETKWRSGSWSDLGEMGARRQVSASTSALRLMTKRFGVERVAAVVVVWGPASKDLPAPDLGRLPVDGSAVVIPGLHLRRWMLSLPGGQLLPDQIRAVHDEVVAHARRRDAHDGELPPSVTSWFWSAGRVVLLSYAALSLAFPITWLPAWGDLACVLAAAGATVVLRRSPRWRLATTAALTIEILYGLAVLASFVGL